VGAAAERADAPLAAVVVAAAIGATCGDCISFAIGRRWGTALLDRGQRRLKAVEHAHEAFARHAGAAVFLGRWVGMLRAVVPVVAGASSMSVRRFLAWNVLASVSWTAAVLTAAYVGGPHAVELVDRIGWAGLALVVVMIVVLVVVRRRRSGPSDLADEPAAPDTARDTT
jgi:membrane protein DedA with SNARE-associated domain